MENSTFNPHLMVLCFFFASLLGCVSSPLLADVNQASRELKEEVGKKIDYISPEVVNEKVDQVADYFDPEKMKQMVDQFAEYFDKEKIRQTVDVFLENFDKEKVKDWIDTAAENFNRDKVKQNINTALSQVDKQKLKDAFNQGVDRATQFIKKEMQLTGGNLPAMQKRLNVYDWKDVITDRTRSDVVTLSDLRLNGYPKVVIVRPGEQIRGEVTCAVDASQSSALSKYQVVLGIKDQEHPVVVYNHIGLRAVKEKNDFAITAPNTPGVYQLGFQVVKAALEKTALKRWERDGVETPVIGLIIVN